MCAASILVLVLPLAAASADGHRSRACSPSRARVLLSDRQARVYLFHDPKEYDYLAGGACAIGHRPLDVSDVIEEDSLEGSNLRSDWRHTFALAGTVVAYAADRFCENKYFPCSQSEWFIVVRNVRTGRYVHHTPSAPHRGNGPHDYYVGVGAASQVVVKPDGAVAWIVPNEVLRKERWRERGERHEPVSLNEQPLTYEIYADDRGGMRRLASGQDVARTSLTIEGNMILWTQGGKRLSAPLL
jgi:hypothetical protein